MNIWEYFNLPPCSTNYHEYEFDSLLDATSDKYVDRLHTYENQLKVGE